jgi:hypothetical protein
LLLPRAGWDGATPLIGGANGRIADPAPPAGLGGGLGMYSPGAVVVWPAPGELTDGVDPPLVGGALYGFEAGGE